MFGESEVFQRDDGQELAKSSRRFAEFVPERDQLRKQAYFVGFPEDEIVVWIRAHAPTRAAAAPKRASASSLRR